MDSVREEYELALSARDGDRECLEELVDRTRGRLFAQAYADLRHYEDAQDAVAAALLQICLHVHELRDPALASCWMRSIVRNEIRRLRRRSGEQAASLEDLELAAPIVDPTLKLDVERALSRAPRDQAQALTLFYLKNVPVREIARITNRPEGTIKTWLRRGRQCLALSLKEYGPMQTASRTTIISSEMSAQELSRVTEAVRSAGYSDVSVVEDPTTVIQLQSTEENPQGIAILPPLSQSQLVVLDDHASGHSAFEVVPLLKADEAMAGVPLVMLANRSSEIKTLCAWQAGFDIYLNHPVDPAELASLIGRLKKK